MEPLLAGDPETIGAYRLVGRLGSGGMGEVFLGRAADGGLAAVKAARSEYAQDAEFRRRFAREVEAARRVDGRFTAAVLDADPAAVRPWFATEYIPGVSVTEAVAAGGPLPEEPLRALIAGAAAALEAIHRTGLTHRDLKPSNVLLAADGPRIIDFGIARSADHTQLTRTGMAPGTPGFMAPEQLRGEGIGPATDVYALGALLVFAATGEGPFGHGDTLTLMYRTLEEEPRLDGVPDALRPMLARCLAKDPGARPSVASLRAEFSVAATLPGGQWLPAEIGTMVVRRQEDSAGARAPHDTPPPPPLPPSAPASPLSSAPTSAAVAPPTPSGFPPGAPFGQLPGQPPTAAERGRLSRRGLFAAAGALVATAAVGGSIAVIATRDDGDGGDKDRAAEKPGGEGQGGDPDQTGTPDEAPAADGSAQGEAIGDFATEPLPEITAGHAFGTQPTVATASGPPPKEITALALTPGEGEPLAAGDSGQCHFTMQVWGESKVVDNSWKNGGSPALLTIGTGEVIPGWDKVLVGRKKGSRTLFAVPPKWAYGDQDVGNGVKPGSTLVFVVDVMGIGMPSGGTATP
ncbi:protein kinase [Streptomyces sp. NA04227]|uniref:protein kinase domain-containing protein n=1 Tax=Streptomyces sp. NA04227 TaxID=2742136 RepID=UPI0015925C6D|nr:protein kinase [Streptomyces sp. NA04227]QKW09731.1 protein kinase [Streptomyces sp. NA04227]